VHVLDLLREREREKRGVQRTSTYPSREERKKRMPLRPRSPGRGGGGGRIHVLLAVTNSVKRKGRRISDPLRRGRGEGGERKEEEGRHIWLCRVLRCMHLVGGDQRGSKGRSAPARGPCVTVEGKKGGEKREGGEKKRLRSTCPLFTLRTGRDEEKKGLNPA